MKIPKPSKPEAPPFKRKRGPPPQATKLLVASLLAALVFMAVLAIVFVPRYLENLNPPRSTVLYLNLTAGQPRVQVTFALYDLSLSDFNATLTRDNVTVADLPAGLSGVSAGLSFTDANHDGLLNSGDSFTLPTGPQGVYRFEVWQLDVGLRVGSLTWTGTVT